MTTGTTKNESDYIVVGVDGSESSKNALRWAAKLAPALGNRIEVVVAWEYPMMLGWEGGIPDWWRPDEDAKKILQESLEAVFEKNPPKGLVSQIRQGHPSTVLLEASKDAQMLIVGSRGHGGFAGLLLGSVSSACAEHATCPVLVVHGEKS
ncbi:universal stress protein [mine drainage metagenome]|uniref:Universal stress protein n=1 Tax=mine drainage metagenome TaxID=410659 RepID=A0A1J5PUJ3_9ZZZZ